MALRSRHVAVEELAVVAVVVVEGVTAMWTSWIISA